MVNKVIRCYFYCLTVHELKKQDEAIYNIKNLMHRFNEFLTYGKEKEAQAWWSDTDEMKAFRFAYGQYLKKGACLKGISFDEFCQALSPDIYGGILIGARKSGAFPDYRKEIAKKLNIGKNCCSTGTGDSCGYAGE